MKKIFTLLLSFVVFYGQAKSINTAYEKLCDVNKCWTEQKDINKLNYPTKTNYTEREWIAIHLQLVEQTLRARSTAHLNAEQKANRLDALNHLNAYWKSGAFPINEDFAYRLPIFIDKHDNFCAVGYLVKATGYEEVSRMVAAKTNYAYVREMDYPELNSWANKYGFTEDELAWIQPGYPPARYVAQVGGGTDGEVIDLFVNGAGDKMYVGGSFKNVDGSIEANNIAYVTEASGVYTWHSMGKGINGKVEAIAEFDNKIFVGGTFTKAGDSVVTNIAYWDGSIWHTAGCLWGEVKDLKVYKGELYACGSFDVCAALADINLAKWNTTYNMWQPMPGLSGVINTMHVYKDELVLGGAFKYASTGKDCNIAKTDGKGTFTVYGNAIEHEVMDIEDYGDTLYAGCKKVAANIDLLKKLVGTSWQKQAVFPGMSTQPIVSFNSLCIDKDTFMASGNFSFSPLLGTFLKNNIDLTPYIKSSMNAPYSFIVDSTINDMVVFKGSVIAGGVFKYGYSALHPVNSIARKVTEWSVNVPVLHKEHTRFDIYPNPATGTITIENNIKANRLTVTDINGRVIRSLSIDPKAKQQVELNDIASGTYVLEVSNELGARSSQKLIIK
ncbi:MAG: T9SS type A sorting domain-containing protein [Flavipsychrobacter sp.]